MLRRLGVRYVLLHRDEFRTPADADAYEAALLAAGAHVLGAESFETVLALRLQKPLPRLDASAGPSDRGPPQRVQCRYLDAGQPDPMGATSSASVAATWACTLPGGTIDAARWTFDLNRPETWPSRLRVEAAAAGAVPAPLHDFGLDIELTSRLADAMLTRPASAPQIVVPFPAAPRGVDRAPTLLVRTWGARASRLTPPFWLEVWSRAR